ncbi:tRNA pseudouridine(55) synthase TruB [Candidatus Gracilibacteria bacterium]|nr:tRNA pseudouridine(55) synthase TruB [Candidatus Gracilibacteria bacterium]MCF7819756.1 tRNA pseudouridine(55) synthase TruB [Candidatus Gracilibacteria bacterium]
MDGFWLIDKEKGWTSFDVCAKLRKILQIKKVGHTGTLDPFATGLLLVATGKCTKLIPFLEKERKTYQTTLVLGKTSDTLDPESEIREEKSPSNSLFIKEGGGKIIEQKMCSMFQGKIQQVPPQFSAIKFKGQKACDMARKGKKVDLESRETEIFSYRILSFEFPELQIELEVAAGFYVRAFARDLAKELGTVGMCQELRRTKIGNLSVDDAQKIDQITEPIDPKFIISLDHREIETGRVQDFISGRAFPCAGVNGDKVLVLVGGKTLGVGEIVHGNLQPRIVL